jgi:hypothetical protein
VLAFLNHFPLFAVMLRFKDPARIPGKCHSTFIYIYIYISTEPACSCLGKKKGGLRFQIVRRSPPKDGQKNHGYFLVKVGLGCPPPPLSSLLGGY